jgi:hypothetical protein
LLQTSEIPAGRKPGGPIAGEEQLSRQSEERLLPWGTRYKRLQIMNERNGVFYSLLRLKGCLMRVRVVYHGASDHEEIRLTTCNLETNEVYSILVKDPVTVERLVNLVMWQREVLEFCPQFLKVSTNFFIDITKALCGRNLFINNVYQDRVSVVRQETVEQTKWNVFCQLETVYLKNFFMKKVLYFATTHKILGKVYVTSTLYSSFKLAKNQLIVLLTISPVRKRFTSHQIVLNSVDLSTYFDADIFKIVHNDQGLVKLFSVVISKLVLYRCRTFSKLAIPLCWVRRLASLRYAELLQNEFDQRDLFGKKETENMEPYLKPQIYSKEVVVKMVVKFNKQYWIMTVTKNLLLDRIDIEGYVPATRRKFQCRMTTYDIDTLSAKTQIEVSKFTPHELTAIVEYCQSFQQFEEMIADRSKCKDAFENKKLHLTKANPHQGSKLLRRSPSSNQGWSNKTCNEVINQISDKNFANLKFWMTLLARAKLLLKHSDLLIEIESFRGVLQEHIWQNVCITDKLKFEICIDLEAERSEVRSSKIVKMFSPINIDSLTNYAFLLKVIFIEQDQQVHVDKVILDGLLKIYGLLLQDKLTKISKLIHMDEESPRIPEELDGEFGQRSRSTVLKSTKLLTDRFNQGFVLKLRQLRLADLVELCRILEVNIIDNILGNYMGVIDSQLTYFNNEKILSREIIYKEKFERRMKLNSRLCLEIMSDPHYKDYNDILLCRTVFTVRPLQTLAILFNKKCS